MKNQKLKNAHGGRRAGAGRKPGSARYGEAMVPMRIPPSFRKQIERMINANGYHLPLYAANIPAGNPVQRESEIEEMIDLAARLFKNPKDTFLLRVTGDSMIDAGIFDGDLLTVDRTGEVRSNKIVVASINGEATVKRLKRGKSGTQLLPENPRFQPIDIKSTDEFVVLGVVTNSIRKHG